MSIEAQLINYIHMSTTNIVCPECLSTNRLPSNRLADNPSCGKCKAKLFQGRVLDLNADNVGASLNHNEIPVLVDCWAPWCGPCRSFAPTFEQAAREMEPNFRLAKLNTEEQQQIAAGWNIRSIPTLILFKRGKELARVSGALSLAQLKQWLMENNG